MQRIEHELRYPSEGDPDGAGQGDLSRNAEYESAKNRQSTIQARFAQIQKRLADLSRIDVAGVPKIARGWGASHRGKPRERGGDPLHPLIPSWPTGTRRSSPWRRGKALMNRRVATRSRSRSPRDAGVRVRGSSPSPGTFWSSGGGQASAEPPPDLLQHAFSLLRAGAGRPARRPRSGSPPRRPSRAPPPRRGPSARERTAVGEDDVAERDVFPRGARNS